MSARRGKPTRIIQTQIPQETFDEIKALCELQGMEISSFLNNVIARIRPTIREKRRDYRNDFVDSIQPRRSRELLNHGEEE